MGKGKRFLVWTIVAVGLLGLLSIAYYIGSLSNKEENMLAGYDSTKIKRDETVKKEKQPNDLTQTNTNKQPDRVYYDVDGMQLSEYEYKDYLEKKDKKELKEFAKKLYDFYTGSEMFWDTPRKRIEPEDVDSWVNKAKNSRNKLGWILPATSRTDDLLIKVKNLMMDYLATVISEFLYLIERKTDRYETGLDLRTSHKDDEHMYEINSLFNKIVNKYDLY